MERSGVGVYVCRCVGGMQDGMRSLNKKGLVCVSVTGVTRRERSWVQQQAVVGGDSRG